MMFFGLTNSPATFQAMINNILKDLIDTRDIVAFIDDILVGIEDKRRYNEMIEKVLKRIKANNLYVKPKKCVRKVKKIDFLELVMGAENIKI